MPLFNPPRNDAPNLLINSGLWLFQRQTPGTATARANATYGPDGFVINTQTNAINCERSTGDVRSRYAVKLTQNQAAAQRFALAQIVEGSRTYELRGRNAVLRCGIKCSASQAIRCAVLSHTGALDTVSRVFVSSWTLTDYVNPLEFFTATGLGNTALTPTAATWTDLSVSVAVPTSANNLLAVVWTEGTAAQNVTLEITEWDLHEGSHKRLWLPDDFALEVVRCQRRYSKSYSLDTIPGSTVGLVGAEYVYGVNANSALASCVFPVLMRGVPTITTYNMATGTAGRIRNSKTGADITHTAIYANQRNIGQIDADGLLADGGMYDFQWVADSDM